MFETTIRDLFRSLEQVIHERLRVVEDVIRTSAVVQAPAQDDELMKLKEAVGALSQQVVTMAKHISVLEEKIRKNDVELLPTHPLEGLEVIPKKEVVISAEPLAGGSNTLSIADRLLLNTKARKALEAQEMGEGIEEHPVLEETEIVEGSEGVEEVEEAVEDAVEEAVEEAEQPAEAEEAEEAAETEEAEQPPEAEETEEAEEAEEAEEVELEEFEYKGSTYYRDADNNVFMTDEDGELLEEPIGVWNEAKQKILVRKPTSS
jgi:hypothetical protein